MATPGTGGVRWEIRFSWVVIKNCIDDPRQVGYAGLAAGAVGYAELAAAGDAMRQVTSTPIHTVNFGHSTPST